MSRRRLTPPERKTALSFHEKIIAAHLYYVQAVDPQTIAFAMNISDVGPVHDACVAVRKLLRDNNREEAPNGSQQSHPSDPAAGPPAQDARVA
jgi:hypothetical protein